MLIARQRYRVPPDGRWPRRRHDGCEARDSQPQLTHHLCSVYHDSSHSLHPSRDVQAAGRDRRGSTTQSHALRPGLEPARRCAGVCSLSTKGIAQRPTADDDSCFRAASKHKLPFRERRRTPSPQPSSHKLLKSEAKPHPGASPIWPSAPLIFNNLSRGLS